MKIKVNKKILRSIAPEYDISSMKLAKEIAESLTDEAEKHVGIKGLAAPQIGISERVILIIHKKRQSSRQQKEIMVNPEILWKFGGIMSNEACESLEDRYLVKRPVLMKVGWYDLDGTYNKKVFMRDDSRIICHECDHLNGKCLDDVGHKWQLSDMYERVKAVNDKKRLMRGDR